MKQVRKINLAIATIASAVSMIVGVVYSFNVDEVYMAHATIQVGHIGFRKQASDRNLNSGRNSQALYSDRKAVETLRSLGEVLRGRYRLVDAAKNNIPMPYLYHIEPRIEGVMNLFSRGRSPEEAEEVLVDVIRWIQQRHDNVYSESIAAISNLQSDLKVALIGREEKQSLAVNAGDSTETPIVGAEEFLDTELGRGEIAYLYREVTYTLLPRYSKPTTVISHPTALKKRLKPKPFLYAVTTIIVSFFVFLAVITIGMLIIRIRKYGIASLWD